MKVPDLCITVSIIIILTSFMFSVHKFVHQHQPYHIFKLELVFHIRSSRTTKCSHGKFSFTMKGWNIKVSAHFQALTLKREETEVILKYVHRGIQPVDNVTVKWGHHVVTMMLAQTIGQIKTISINVSVELHLLLNWFHTCRTNLCVLRLL